MSLEIASVGMFEYQAPATLNQAAPVQNTWYTLLDTESNVRIYHICVGVEDTNETLEVQITIDGETIAADDEACTHSNTYHAWIFPNAINRTDLVKLIIHTTTDVSIYKGFLIEGKSVKVEVRKTTAAGAGNLVGICVYGELRKV